MPTQAFAQSSGAQWDSIIVSIKSHCGRGSPSCQSSAPEMSMALMRRSGKAQWANGRFADVQTSYTKLPAYHVHDMRPFFDVAGGILGVAFEPTLGRQLLQDDFPLGEIGRQGMCLFAIDQHALHRAVVRRG